MPEANLRDVLCSQDFLADLESGVAIDDQVSALMYMPIARYHLKFAIARAYLFLPAELGGNFRPRNGSLCIKHLHRAKDH